MKALLLLLLASSLYSTEMVERTQMLMGTYATISLPQEKSRELQKSFEILQDVEASLSSYDPNADIYRLNHQGAVTLSPYSYEALLLSKRYYRESDGYFDITVGSITKELYRFGEDERLVTAGALQKARIDFKGLHFSQTRASLDEGVAVDLGGMGKGFGVDKVAEYLKEQNITEGEIALSGDIRCLDICKIEVQNPFGEGRLAEFRTKYPGTAISTSGNYRRYIESRKNNHLIDPKAKHSQQLFASITLVSRKSNSDIDAYATAASVMPYEKAVAFLEQRGVGYVLILTNGERIVSADIDRYVLDLVFVQLPKVQCERK